MSKHIWKWVFSVLPDERIIKLAKDNIRVLPGFRVLSLDKIELQRPSFEVNLIKHIGTIAKEYHKDLKGADTSQRCRLKLSEELYEEIRNGSDVVDIFLTLLSSFDSQHHQLAEELYDMLNAGGELNEYSQAALSKIQQTRREREAQKEAEEQEKKARSEEIKRAAEIKKQERKTERHIENLEREKEEITKENGRLKNKISELESANKNLELSIQDLKRQHEEFKKKRDREYNNAQQIAQQQITELKHQLEVQSKTNHENQLEITELKSTLKTVQAQQMVNELNRGQQMALFDTGIPSTAITSNVIGQISGMISETAITKSSLDTSFEKSEIEEQVSVGSDTLKIKVALVCKDSSTMQGLVENDYYEIEIFEFRDLDKYISGGVFNAVEQVWFPEYESLFEQSLKLRRHLGAKLREPFKDFYELKTFAFSKPSQILKGERLT